MASKADYKFFKEYKRLFLEDVRYRGKYLVILNRQIVIVMDTYPDAYKYAEAVLGSKNYLISHVVDNPTISVVSKSL